MFASSGARFAMRVISRFQELGLVTDDDIAQAGGPSSTTMTKFRAAMQEDLDFAMPRGDTRKRIEKAARWKAGSALALWNGGEPTPLPDEHDDEIGFTTWDDMKNPRYDAKHMARRLDELAEENAELRRRLAAAEERIEELHSSDPRTPEEADEDARTFAAMAEQFEAEARALGLTDAEYLQHLRSEWGEPIESPLAARRGLSQGQQLRRVQDEAGEENQDNGGSDGGPSS